MRTDLTILRALKTHRARLASGEETAFRRMLEDLEAGMVARLTRKQREWAEKRYLDLKLDKEEGKPLPAPPEPKSGPVPTFPWEKNRPLKPPGKM
jgi:hypothetical protein